MSEVNNTRRAFIAGLAVTTTALASCGGGSQTASSASTTAATSELTVLGETVRIAGENGIVEGRLVELAPGLMGGTRPAGLRLETLVVNFQVDSRTAPLGNAIYEISRKLSGLQRLFLTRGEDVNGQTLLTAILN